MGIYYPAMAAFVVSSRFSGLQIEDDDTPPNSLQQKQKKVVNKNTIKKVEPEIKTKSQPTKSQVDYSPQFYTKACIV